MPTNKCHRSNVFRKSNLEAIRMLGYVVIVIVCLLGPVMGFSPVNTGRGEL